MILACPSCNANYVVSPKVFAHGPRQVRCARCGHGWLADLPMEINVVPVTPEAAVEPAANAAPKPDLPPVTPPPETVPPIPAGSSLPTLWRDPRWQKLRLGLFIGLGVLGFIILIWLVVGRQGIVHGAPWMERVYNAIGLTIYHPGDGLSLQKVRSERRFEDGTMHLIVEGEIRNDSPSNQKIPNMAASAIGPDGKIMQGWRISAPAATLAAGESVPFQSSVHSPPGTVVEINLNFAELPHEE